MFWLYLVSSAESDLVGFCNLVIGMLLQAEAAAGDNVRLWETQVPCEALRDASQLPGPALVKVSASVPTLCLAQEMVLATLSSGFNQTMTFSRATGESVPLVIAVGERQKLHF